MKPSKINALKAKKAFFLFSGFRALTWKGVVYCKRESDVALINSNDKITTDFESHEMIHVKQAESTNDSWFKFYFLYIWYWILNFPLFIQGIMMPYYFIPFELEAYNNEINWKYPTNGSVYEWKLFNEKLSLKKKYNLAKEYKNDYRGFSFKYFARTVIYPIIKKD